MRIVSDINGLERVAGPDTEVLTFEESRYPARWARNLRLFKASLGADYLIIHFQLSEIVFFGVLLFLIPFHHCRLVTLDFFVEKPKSWQLPPVRWALGRVHKLLVYFRDSSRYQA